MTRRERLERRAEKRREWAEKAEARSDAAFEGVRRIADNIPLGQPILVGHHSEGRARRDQDRIHNGMSRGCAEAKLAEHHKSKAGGLEHALEQSIFSDDADAIAQLEARIAEREAEREQMKLINKLYRKGDAAGLEALGVNLERLRAKLVEAGPYWGSAPHLPYEMTNLGANIRRDRQRIEDIRRRAARTQAAEAAGGVTIEGGTEPGSWCRVTFAEKPPRATLDALKAAGFHWGGGSWCGPREKLPAAIVAEGGAA
jgi:hypothetical protein